VWVVQAVNIPGAAKRAGEGRQARGAALVYLTNFIATAIGAVLGAVVWEAGGWPAIGAMAAATAAGSLGLDLIGRAAWSRGRPADVTERSG
jgi:predicted MFS family arabinose efflux permease